MEALIYPSWRQSLFDALVEIDRKQQLVRLAQVEAAMPDRRQQLHDIAAEDEKQALEDASHILEALREG